MSLNVENWSRIRYYTVNMARNHRSHRQMPLVSWCRWKKVSDWSGSTRYKSERLFFSPFQLAEVPRSLITPDFEMSIATDASYPLATSFSIDAQKAFRLSIATYFTVGSLSVRTPSVFIRVQIKLFNARYVGINLGYSIQRRSGLSALQKAWRKFASSGVFCLEVCIISVWLFVHHTWYFSDSQR